MSYQYYLKKIFVLAMAVVFLSMQSLHKGRSKLLCHKWQQYGYKEFPDSVMKRVADSISKKIVFNSDGSYEEKIFSLSGKGKWSLNDNQTRFGISFVEYNGIKMGETDTTIVTNMVILKLTGDTLIYGTEGYAGKLKGTGYDEYYFVRIK